MMTEWVPQVGDKVSIEGEVECFEMGIATVRCGGPSKAFASVGCLTLVSRSRPAWTQEPGALGIDPHGIVWQRAPNDDTWFVPGLPESYAFGDIPQPLRRLVPED